jgi:predicted ester cyclase
VAVEANMAILRRAIEEIFNRGNLAVADDLIAPDYINRDATPGQVGGPAGIRFVATTYRTAFPDLHLAIEEMLAIGDTVVVRVRETGTHLGPFLGAAPTGRHVGWTWIGIYRVRDGRLVERWGVIESLDLLRQLGLVATG